MNEKYDLVPKIISGKDLDYLSDMFNWNYCAYKCSYNAVENVNDQEIKSLIEQCCNQFNCSMSNILNILKDGGSNE